MGATQLGWADSLPGIMLDGSLNTIVSRAADSMFVSMWRAPVDTKVPSAEAEIAPFVVWAYIVAEDALPAGVDKFSQRQMLDLALQRSQHFDGGLWVTMFNSEVESVSLVPLKTMPELPLWESSAVTLIGDAVHNMTLLAGIGANTALRDARLLHNALVEVASGQSNLKAAISNYENQMRLYANEAVVQSLRNAQNAVSASWFKRTIFRTLLRIAEALPEFKAKMFPPGK
jgi:2-polyprenyl-6-methoxyphenol hydroxylase-like FAD-dependent oxidoreductase